MFGSATNKSGTGLFGGSASSTTNTASSGGGLFGGGTATNTASSGGGLFGGGTATNTASSGGGGLFGGVATSTNGTVNAGASGGLMGLGQQPHVVSSMVEQQLRFIENRITNDFKVELFADKNVTRGLADEQYKYIDGTDNPNPGRLAGVDIDTCLDMKARLGKQNEQIDDIAEKALGLKKQLLGECQQMQEKCRSDLQNYTDKLLNLSCKVIEIIKKIVVVRANGRGLRAEEEIFRSKLISLQRELEKPNNCKARLAELHSRFKMMYGEAAGTDTLCVDTNLIFAPDNMGKLKQVLASANVGISKLFETLNDDAADMTLIHKELVINGR